MGRDLVGVPKEGPVKKWLEQRKQWDHKFASTKRKVHKRFIDDLAIGYEGFGEGEFPPPSALAGRRRKEGASKKPTKRSKSMGLALWSLWGSKHDKMTMNREEQADKNEQSVEMATATGAAGHGARPFADIETQRTSAPNSPRGGDNTSRSRRRIVTYEQQDENGNSEEEAEVAAAASAIATEQQLLTPGYQPQQHQPEVGIGTTGKRPYVDGIAVPFSLKKEAETASMMTLMSNGPASPRASTTSRPMSPLTASEGGIVYCNGDRKDKETEEGNSSMFNVDSEKLSIGDVSSLEGKGKGNGEGVAIGRGGEPALAAEGSAGRPDLETFVTAAEALPTARREKA